MELVEGLVRIGDDANYPDTDAFVDALGTVADEHGVTVQAFDARLVVSERHLERALELADRERARGDAIARERAVEVLLYAAGRRQIDRALELGVGPGETPAVVLVAADEGGDEAAAADAVRELLVPADTLGDFDTERVCDFFEIGDAERAATDAGLADLVLERVALLVVER